MHPITACKPPHRFCTRISAHSTAPFILISATSLQSFLKVRLHCMLVQSVGVVAPESGR